MRTITLKTKDLGLKEPIQVPVSYRIQELAAEMQVQLLKIDLNNVNDKAKSDDDPYDVAKIVEETQKTLEYNQKTLDYVKTIGHFDKKTMENIKDNADINSLSDWVNYSIMRIQGFSDKEVEEVFNPKSEKPVLDPKGAPAN